MVRVSLENDNNNPYFYTNKKKALEIEKPREENGG